MRRFISIMLMLLLAGAAGASPLDGVRKAFVEKTIENYAYCTPKWAGRMI